MFIPLTFHFPRDGVVLTQSAGVPVGEKLEITCILSTESGNHITVNGSPAEMSTHGIYQVKATLSRKRNVLVARCAETGEEVLITVFYMPDMHMKYQFTLDDNIWCFQNIAKNAASYRSLFEEPYLNPLKTMHDRYGTVFHLNIYYQCPEFGGFDLSMMPDKFKAEWLFNADWLRLTFHGRENLPDRLYMHSGYDEVLYDCDRVHREILRFAGEQSLNLPATTVHWGDCGVEAIRALRTCGYRIFGGSFNLTSKATVNAPVTYYLGADECALMNLYGSYYDKANDVFFRMGGLKAQHTPLDKLTANLDQYTAEHPFCTYHSLCVHEEYFYPHYINYMPDYPERFDKVIRWHAEHGFKPAFVGDVMEL